MTTLSMVNNPRVYITGEYLYDLVEEAVTAFGTCDEFVTFEAFKHNYISNVLATSNWTVFEWSFNQRDELPF